MKIPMESDYFPDSGNILVNLGRFVLVNIRNSGIGVMMVLESFLFFPLFHRRWSELVRQMFTVGIKSFGVVSLVAFFTGMILSLQAGIELRDYGQEMRVGTLVTESMFREMGPFMAALILAACVGSAMAAELGTMAVSEEIAALEVMSINPVYYLVMPRILAMMIMCPALTVYTNIIGVIGGGAVAYSQLDVEWRVYYDYAVMYLDMKEVLVGTLKALVFAVIVAGVGCYQGVATRGGAVGVGIATRRSVVISFLLIIAVGYFITRSFY
ncbi:MAG TPA: ABC transporter permease [Victivallales bacterium]|nr:ABC transporter permease [Victivallales bacterium]